MVTKPSLFISAPLITERKGCVAAERGCGVCTAPSLRPCSHLCQLCFTFCLHSGFGGQDQGSRQLGVGTKAPDTFKGQSSDPMKVLFAHIPLLNEPWGERMRSVPSFSSGWAQTALLWPHF